MTSRAGRGPQAVTALLCAVFLGVAFAGPSIGEVQPPFPLAAYPGFGHNPERDEARFDAEERERENLIAKCMTDKGFFYEPSPSVRITDDGPSAEELMENFSNDANFNYLKLLSPQDRERYYMALAGVKNEYDYVKYGGCAGQALKAVTSVYAAASRLREELRELEADILNDPEVRSATQEWAECMKAEGTNFSNPTEVHRWRDDQIGKLRSEQQRSEADRFAEWALELGRRCEESSGLKSAKIASRVRHEDRFVDEHKDTLERHRLNQQRPPLE